MNRLIILSALLFLSFDNAPGAEPVLKEEFNALKKDVEDLSRSEGVDRQEINSMGIDSLKDKQKADHEMLAGLQARVKDIDETRAQLRRDLETVTKQQFQLDAGLERVRKLESAVELAAADARFAKVYLTAASSVAGFVVILCSLFFSVRLTSLYERTAVQEALQTHIIDLKSRLAVLEARPGVEEPG
jgi:hypothetical protein